MLSRGEHVSSRLFKLSLRSKSIRNRSTSLIRVASHRYVPSRRFPPNKSFDMSTPSLHASASKLQLQRFSHIVASHSPVPEDEYDELKSFLADPSTSGAVMERAKEIVTGWMQQYVDPAMPGQDATVMVMVADAMKDPNFVMQVYTCLRDAGVSPSPITLECAAAACAELGLWPTAFEIIDFMHEAVEIMQPSISIYENAIASCHVAKKWIKAKQLLEEMRTYGLEASLELHVASIRLCIESNEPTATKVLFHAFLRAYAEELDLETKHKLLSDLFDAAIDAQSLSQALFFRDELGASQCSVSKDFYTRLIHLCAIKRQWHQARVLLQQSIDINAPPPRAASSNRYTDDIRRLLKEMHANEIEIPLAVYNAALRNFGQISLSKDASAVYSDMRRHQVQPDAVSFAALMCSCGTQSEDSEEYFRQLQRYKCKPTLDVVHAYLLVPSRAKEWKEVIRRYAVVHDEDPLFKHLAMESDVRIQSLVAVALGRLDRSEAMLRVFTSMKVQGMEPNLHVYGEALFAYIRQDQWRHALMLFDHLFQHQTSEMQEKRVLETFPMLWDAAVLACMKGEQMERAEMLFDTIGKQRVLISMTMGERLAAMLTRVPSETIWRSFQSIPSLHRTKTNSRLNPRVLNAVLKRAVEENDSNLAEKIVTGMNDMKMRPNSMTFALMLRLYANREDQEKFYDWWCNMEKAKVRPTLFIFRALLQQLSVLSLECENVSYFQVFEEFLLQRQSKDVSIEEENVETPREYAALLGRLALDSMEHCDIGPDTICLQNYLLLSQAPEHVACVLELVETATLAVNEQEEYKAKNVHLSSRLLHTLFTALSNFPDPQRVRKLLVQMVKDLPQDLSEDAIAAFCATNSSHEAVQLLRELVDAHCCLTDNHILYFLTNSFTSQSSSAEVENSRPRSVDGSIVDMATLLCETKRVTMEAGCLAFLLQHVVELSKWQLNETFEISTQKEIHAMKNLLLCAFSKFPMSQVREFLQNVIAKEDLVHVESILDEL